MVNFDEVIDRRHTNSMNVEGYREYLFKGADQLEIPYADEDLIRMWIADMEFATPEIVIEGIRERLNKKIFGYSRLFSDDYYDAFLTWCQKKYGWEWEKEHLVTSNGIIPALYELVEYICEVDERVLFFTPSYAYFKYAADYNNREAIPCDLLYQNGKYEIDFEEFERVAADKKNRLLILCNPHNPTGRMWTEWELQQIGKIAFKHDLWIISDEIHCDLLRKGKKHIPLAKLFPQSDKVITCMAPSKTFNIAGLQFSNVLIPNEELRKTWLARHYNFDNPLSIAAAQAAYENGEVWLEELKEYLDKNFQVTKRFIDEHLPKAHMNIPESTYLAWVDVGRYFPEKEDLTYFFATEAGVLLESEKMFIQNSAGYIRLNLACPKSVLEEGLKRIAKAINNHEHLVEEERENTHEFIYERASYLS